MLLAIKSKQVIDGTGRDPIPAGIVLVEGERIKAVDRPERVPLPTETEILDLSQDTVLPGLVDAHSHVVLRESEKTAAEQHLEPDTKLVLRGARNIREDLLGGGTTMRTMSDRNFLDVSLREAVVEGEVPGPRLLISTRGIRSTHGWGSSGVVANGVEEVRRTVRENLLWGADVIKLMITGWAGRKPVAAHVNGGPGLRWALEAGLDTVEHGGEATDDDLELFLATGAWLVFTLTVLCDPIGLEKKHAWQVPEFREGLIARRERLRRLVPKVAASGVNFTIGTDARHGRLHLEMAYLVKFGLSPMDAIVAGTKRAAEALRVVDQVGTLEVGKLADVISVKGDPLEDIRAMGQVGLIMKGGKRYDTISRI